MNVLGVYPGDAGPLGGECVGKIVGIGQSVRGYKVGQKVIVSLAASCFGSHVIAESSMICPMPDSLSANQAATLPVTFGTAYHSLIDLAKIKKGERVLIHAAAGGVGLAAIQIAQQQGAEVFATASPGKQAYLKSIGVSHVYNSRNLDFADQIKQELGGEGIDVILNSLAENFIKPSMALLNPGGRYVEIGKADVWTVDRVEAHCKDTNKKMSYFHFDLVIEYLKDPKKCRKIMDAILLGIKKGYLAPLPQIVYPQSQVIDAFRLMSQGKHIGKIVLQNEDFNSVEISPDKSYLISGGNGGLGLKCAEYLVGLGAKEILLIGRSALKDEAKATIESFSRSDVNIHYESIDVANFESVQKINDTVVLPLGGVIHAAGVTEDALISNQSFKSLQKVMQPKIAGSWNLHQLTKDMPLDFFVMFSSVASVLGSPGQANYAAANSFMDGLSQYRSSIGLAATSINWGPWGEVGMATNDASQKNTSGKGFNLINPSQGTELLGKILKFSPVQVSAFFIDWGLLASQYKKVGMPFPSLLSDASLKISELGEDASGGNGIDAGTQAMAKDLREKMDAAYPADRELIVSDSISSQLRNIMSIPADVHIDPNAQLAELGIDSLVAVELRNILCALTDKQLPATLLFKHPTIKALSTFIVYEIYPEDDLANDQEGGGLLMDDEITDQESVTDQDEEDEMSADELLELLESTLKE